MNLEQLKLLIAARLDVTDILDILGWDTNDLVEALDEIGLIEENSEAFEDAVA